ncbi:hypothetical protein Plec18170_002357 [Paecilomyces lecythidis]
MAGDASRNDPGASKPQDGATADVSTKGTTCPSRSDPPRTFRFVMGASKPRKRRKTTSRTGEDAPTKQVQSGGDSLLSEEAPLAAAYEYNNNNAGLLNCGLVENYLGEFGMSKSWLGAYRQQKAYGRSEQKHWGKLSTAIPI